MTQIKSRETFRAAMYFAAGACIGSLIGYFLDPDRGSRRRVLLRDKAAHSSHRAWLHGRKLARRMKHRAVGLGMRMVKTLRGKGVVEDTVLRDRVRAWLGHRVEHPRLLNVEVANGVVTISGVAVGLEPDEIVNFVRHVDGVRQVINRLTPVEQQFMNVVESSRV